MKNVVIYWCEFRGKQANLLSFLGSKKKVYLDLFDQISDSANLYLVFGRENYLGGMRFKNYHLYRNGSFQRFRGEILADAVLDRSRSLSFPRRSKTTNQKILNQLDFKKLVGDKWFFYKNFKKYSPKTYLCSSSFLLESVLRKFSDGALVVVKPRYGMKGQDILIGDRVQVKQSKIKYPVVVQEFVETNNTFIKGSRSDIRVVVIDAKPVYAVVRTPQKGSLLANVAQGGSIDEVDLNNLPKDLLGATQKIARDITKKYQNPFYSIDFGITKDGFVIFEMNNFIGFPLIGRKNQKLFIGGLAKVLLEKASS